MTGKIALEEHIESPDFAATGSHKFTDSVYFGDVNHRLQEYKLRLEDMDATGIETTILSLTQPGIEGVTDKNKAIDTAKRMNDHMAEFFVANNPGRFLGFAAVPLQDPQAAAKELERAVKQLGFKGLSSTVTQTSGMRTRHGTLTKLLYGSSGSASNRWTCLSICILAFLCRVNSVSTKVTKDCSVLPGALASRRLPTPYA
jgi:Amidohydrolase